MSDKWRIQFFGDYLNGLHRRSVAVEIGVYKGDYMLDMVRYCRGVNWYGIDPYKVYKSFSTLLKMPKKKFWEDMYLSTTQRIKDLGCRRITLIRKKSLDALNDVPNELDFVYIDGDHNYKSVLSDITAWEPKVRIGGIIAGHDYNKTKDRHRKMFSGVIKAVDEYAQAHDRPLNLDIPGNWYWVKS